MDDGLSTGARHGGPSAAGTPAEDAQALPVPTGPRLVGSLLGVLRLAMAWLFVWPFLDKLFGLGFSVCRQDDGSIDVGCDAAMISGGSPTYGFLSGATQDSHLGRLFSWMAPPGPGEITVVDVAFMAALLVIGVGLALGVAMRLVCAGGAVLLVMMYLAGFVWPTNNPFLDEHLVYALVLVLLAAAGAGRWFGLGRWWERLSVVSRTPLLR